MEQLCCGADDSNRTTPVGLTNGVSSQPLGPWCDGCSEGACSQCKVTDGRDWTYTTYVPLATEEAKLRHR